jgi:hypothetical protein
MAVKDVNKVVHDHVYDRALILATLKLITYY